MMEVALLIESHDLATRMKLEILIVKKKLLCGVYSKHQQENISMASLGSGTRQFH